MSLEYEDSILVYLDILGFSSLIKNEKDAENLLTWIKNTKKNNTEKCYVELIKHVNGEEMKVWPAITSFSDSVVLSIPLKEIPKPFNFANAVNSLLQLIQQLADSLMCEGYLLRGGMVRGDLYHESGVVFGNSLIKAYELESKLAKMPRILVENYSGRKI